MKQAVTLAEVIAVGDEMTSGQRLDTNSQWLAQQLNDLGIEVGYHSTVADDLQRQVAVIQNAMTRAEVVLMTGGLGPTKDDLTRQAIADAAQVELVSDGAALAHIESIFRRNKREMSPANRAQSLYPDGGRTIHNEEGTAPGVDFSDGSSRVFAMPGVPYEMKLMWESYVGPEIAKLSGNEKVIRHHVLRCFGIGESQAESMMPDLIDRQRQPRVGITASYSVISFRITAIADSEQQCLEQIAETESYIRQTLGGVVFGSGDETLGGVSADLLVQKNQSVSFVDFQFGSAASKLLFDAMSEQQRPHFRAGLAVNHDSPQQWVGDESLASEQALQAAATKIRQQSGSDIGIAIGQFLDQDPASRARNFPVAICFGEAVARPVEVFRFAGHSSMRDIRSAYQVVDFLRRSLN